jgi:hypothetical protein
MGCNCNKGKTQRINNLKSKEHLKLAVVLYDELINVKPTTEFNDLDWLEVYTVYNSLYPNSSQQPSKEDAIEKIKLGRNLYLTNHHKK